jgi:hypothetical protein
MQRDELLSTSWALDCTGNGSGTQYRRDRIIQETGDRRRETGDGRWEMGDGFCILYPVFYLPSPSA